MATEEIRAWNAIDRTGSDNVRVIFNRRKEFRSRGEPELALLSRIWRRDEERSAIGSAHQICGAGSPPLREAIGASAPVTRPHAAAGRAGRNDWPTGARRRYLGGRLRQDRGDIVDRRVGDLVIKLMSLFRNNAR